MYTFLLQPDYWNFYQDSVGSESQRFAIRSFI